MAATPIRPIRKAKPKVSEQETTPMKWITRERPKIDRIACP